MIYMVLKKSVRAKEQLNEARILGLREAIVAIFCDKPELFIFLFPSVILYLRASTTV
jgi:hypothetical protein